jgi:hypothetical protein
MEDAVSLIKKIRSKEISYILMNNPIGQYINNLKKKKL